MADGTHYEVRTTEDPGISPLGPDAQVLVLSLSASEAAETLTALWDEGLMRGRWSTIVAVQNGYVRPLNDAEAAEVERVYADKGRAIERAPVRNHGEGP